MDETILTSIKKQLNIPAAVTQFDQDVMLLINAAFATLNQLGVGPEEGFALESGDEVWGDFYNDVRLDQIKNYVYLRVRTVFDPPVGSILSSYNNVIKEEEWRLSVAAEELKRND